MITIIAHKYCPDDQDFKIEFETKLKTRKDFKKAMKHMENGGKYWYRLFDNEKFVAGLISDNIL
jgi:hypothetical protein